MVRKRKVGYSEEIPNMDNEYPILFAERNEMMKLTRMVKAWEFTCSFCFKKFPSAQAMGGHQNAHRHERTEERRLYIRDPIGYRKWAYIRAMKEQSSTNPGPKQVLKFNFFNSNGPPNILQKPLAANIINNNKSYFFQPLRINGDSRNVVPAVVVMGFLPPKELRLVDSVGGQDVKGKVRMEIDAGGCGLMDMEKKLDLTLKL